ncbi:MAG: GEVED domain-containing protein [Bacteroidota bacterium]
MKKNYFKPYYSLSKILVFLAGLFMTSFTFGQIAQRGTATTSTSTANTITIAKPTGVVAGDIMIANIVSVDGNNLGGDNADLTGWTSINAVNLSSNKRRGTILYKIATGTEPANYSFNVSNGTGTTDFTVGAILAYSGVDNVTPFDVAPGTLNANVGSATVTAASITTTTANTQIIMLGMADLGAVTFSTWNTTSPGVLTELYDVSNSSPSVGAASFTKATAGATGAGTVTISSSQGNAGILLALRQGPVISGLSTSSACPGSSITITGTNLAGATSVTIGGTNVASITSNTATQIIAVIGAGSTGPVVVTTPNGVATSAASFTVNAAPTITSQPVSTPICTTGAGTFSVTATGATTYQWRKGGVNLTNVAPYSGVNTATLTITNPTIGDAGNYDVVVGNGTCSTTSNTAVLTVNTVPTTVTTPTPTNAATGICYTGTGILTNLSWGAIAGTTSYDIYFGAGSVPGSITANVATNSYTVGALTASTTYYWRVVAKNACGNAVTSATFTFTTAAIPCASAYCVPAPTSVDGTGITNVTMGSINNNSGAEAGNYGNYSAQTTTVMQGETVPFSIRFQTGFTYDTYIWVDWNNDGDFTDTGELVYTGASNTASPTILSGTFLVPSTATLGNHRLRIGGMDNGTINPCYTGSYAAFEDYTINVTSAPLCSGNPSTLSVFLVSQTSTTVSWTAATPAPGTGYQYYYSTSSTFPNAGTTPSGSVGAGITSATLTGLTAGTKYYFWVRSNCGGGLGQGLWTGPISFTQPTCAIGSGTGTTALGCPNNAAGGLGLSGSPAPAINCSTASCVDLEAIYSPIKETTSYAVSSITYAPPYQYSCLRNPVSVNDDDVWSPVVNLPFNFCFYGNSYNKCLIGSNGIITFDIINNDPDGDSGWSFSSNTFFNNPSSIPVSGHTALVENSIFGGFQDLDPEDSGEVGWELITLNTGCRALVASWSDVPMYDNDTTNNYTGMMVLYENTNIIDVYVQRKRITTFEDSDGKIWNEGNAVIGIQNATGTDGLAAPNRNGLSPNWEATNEAWRFTPNGANVPASVKWHEGAGTTGTEVGSGNTVSVCPSVTTTYTAEVTYTLCNGLVHKIAAQTPVTVNIDRTWNGSAGTNWNTASNWTPSGVPLATHSVSIPNVTNDPIISGGVTAVACSVSVENGGILTINSNNNITVTNAVKVAPTGQFIVQNTANLVQINNVANSGNIQYNRTATGLHARDYIYWSTPVENFGVANVSPLTSLTRIYHWVPNNNNGTGFGYGNWLNVNENMIAGKGYIVRVPNSNPTFSTTLTGRPQNGIITKSILRGPYTGVDYSGTNSLITKYDDNWNLVGNPYPSAIDAIEFLTANNSSIMGEVSLWTHTTPISITPSPYYQTYIYNYKSNDYVTYNSAGNNVGPTGGFNGKIAGGQAFFVKMIDGTPGSGNITFNNGMRTDASNNPYNNSQFYRTSNNGQAAQTEPEKHRVWLDLIDSEMNTSRVMFGYMQGATNGKDHMYDATTNYTESLKAFTTIDENEDIFVIQGKGLPFKTKDKISYGIQVSENATYTIAISDVDGLFKNNSQKVYIEDLLTNVTQDLTTSPYTFTSDKGTFKNRFLIKFEDQTLANNDVEYANGVIVFGKQQLTVKSELINIDNITVYDVLGKKLISLKDINKHEISINELKPTTNVLLVKVTLENGAVVTKKVIY